MQPPLSALLMIMLLSFRRFIIVFRSNFEMLCLSLFLKIKSFMSSTKMSVNAVRAWWHLLLGGFHAGLPVNGSLSLALSVKICFIYKLRTKCWISFFILVAILSLLVSLIQKLRPLFKMFDSHRVSFLLNRLTRISFLTMLHVLCICWLFNILDCGFC